MVRMGAVWDRTVEVLAGRGATIARVALLTLFLPSVIQAAFPLVFEAGSAAKLAGALIGLVVFVVTLLGTLAITALASDPATDERRAYGIARATLPSTIGAVLLIGLAMVGLLIPGMVLIAASGFDFRAAQQNLPQTSLRSGPLLGASLYFLAFAAFAVWVAARLSPLYAVLVNERRGLRSIARAFALTRGLALRIVGVLILYAVVVTVAWAATAAVTGTVFRLVLGPDHPAPVAFLVAVATGAVLTGFGVLQPVFTARLYAAIREVREGAAPVA